MKLTEEELMAYIDGEPGSATERIAQKQRTGFSADEARMMADFHRTRHLVRSAFADDEREPLPARLIDQILAQNPRASGSADVISLERKVSRGRWYGVGAMAVAVSLVVAIGIASWPVIKKGPELSEGLAAGPVPAGSTLAVVLKEKATGDPVAIPSSAGSPHTHLMVAGTFRDRNARVCLEVELLDPTLAPRMAAVACRAPITGLWHVEGTAVIAEAGATGSTAIVPAGTPEADALGAFRTMLGATATLPPDEERKLLDGGWK